MKYVWKFQWLANGGVDSPVDCRLLRYSDTDPAEVIKQMTRFGTPRFFLHVEGPGIIWDNGGNWGVWVLTVEPD